MAYNIGVIEISDNISEYGCHCIKCSTNQRSLYRMKCNNCLTVLYNLQT